MLKELEAVIQDSVLSQAAAAAYGRYKSREAEREAFQKNKDEKQYDRLNNAGRLLKRLVRLGAKETLARDLITGKRALSDVISDSDIPQSTKLGLERVLQNKNFLPTRFLEEGQRAARTVGKIIYQLGGKTFAGTGFLVAPGVLLTNHHVLSEIDQAREAHVQFEFEENEDGTWKQPLRLNFDPDTFFFSNEDFDCTFVTLDDREGISRKLGYCPLIPSSGKISLGEHVNIIQHPDGRPKEIAVRENKLVDIPEGQKEKFLYYTTDTERGSSGSPVFNDEWEVLALHHKAVPKTRKSGEKLKPLTKDGKIWKEGMDPSLIKWVANEGVRASRLVELLKKSSFDRSSYTKVRDQIVEAGETAPTPVEKASNPKRGDNQVGDDLNVELPPTVTETSTVSLMVQLHHRDGDWQATVQSSSDDSDSSLVDHSASVLEGDGIDFAGD